MSSVIKVENLSKQYRLGEIGTGSISHDINRWWHTVRGKEDPYLKIGETNDRSKKGDSEYVWSLKDINFEIEQGDAVGIIGRNGAGKSTLLKILSRVTGPTTGNLKVKGRIASLLEVGTGFHPELSGRENIFLNGAILGMRKHEIQRKFDEIVDFSGVERYIDTPVKRYSSGMYVRLAFAVAAHLESEILIVDEVLAVGDAEFQKKCLGKMGEVNKGEGRTVLFVSHNIDSIRELTNKCILLNKGLIESNDLTENVVLKYQSYENKNFGIINYDKNNWEVYKGSHLLGEIEICSASLLDTENCYYTEGSAMNMEVSIKGKEISNYKGLAIGMRLMSINEKPIGAWFTKPEISLNKNEQKTINLKINSLDIAPGQYYFTIWIGLGDYTEYGKDMYAVNKVFQIEILPKKGNGVTTTWATNSWGNVIFKNLEII